MIYWPRSCIHIYCMWFFCGLLWFRASPLIYQRQDKKYRRKSVWSNGTGSDRRDLKLLSSLNDDARWTVKTDGGHETQSDVRTEYKKSPEMIPAVFSVQPWIMFQVQLLSPPAVEETSFTNFSVLQVDSYAVLFKIAQITMQLTYITVPEWHGDVSEATERQGQWQHLRSSLTKGSCNCATDCKAALNVTGYNGRSSSEVGLRGQRLRGAPEGGGSWFLTGAARSAPSQVHFGLSSGFLLPLSPSCQLSESARTMISSPFCLALVSHSSDLRCYSFSTSMTSKPVLVTCSQNKKNMF